MVEYLTAPRKRPASNPVRADHPRIRAGRHVIYNGIEYTVYRSRLIGGARFYKLRKLDGTLRTKWVFGGYLSRP